MDYRVKVLSFVGLLSLGGPLFSLMRQDGKWPVPPEADRKKVERQVRDLFKAEYQARDSAGRHKFGDRLLAEALAIKDASDGATKYVLLSEAKELHSQATQDLERAMASAFKAVEALDASFEGIPAIGMKSEVLSGLRKNARSPADQEAVGNAFMDLAEDALRADDYKTALVSARAAEKIGQALKNAAMAQEAGESVRRMTALEKEFAEARRARSALDANPADPAANLVYGRFLCGKEAWEEAMPFLARCGDADLEEAATMEIALASGRTADADASIRIAEKWESVARRGGGALDRERFTVRAAYWYQNALAAAESVILRSRVEKKLQELGAAAGSRAVKVTFHWSCADDADVYVNGRPLRKYEPDYRTRPDEAPQSFSCEGNLGRGDVITVGARRGGSYGLLLVAVDARNRIVWKTDVRDWRVYFPAEGDNLPWYHPSVARNSRSVPAQKAAGWPPQAQINARFGGASDSIWHTPESATCFLFSIVR